MKNLILVVGCQGSGKSTLASNLLAQHLASKIGIFAHKIPENAQNLGEKFSAILIEEVSSIKELETIATTMTPSEVQVIVTSQKPINEFSNTVLASYDIVMHP